MSGEKIKKIRIVVIPRQLCVISSLVETQTVYISINFYLFQKWVEHSKLFSLFVRKTEIYRMSRDLKLSSFLFTVRDFSCGKKDQLVSLSGQLLSIGGAARRQMVLLYRQVSVISPVGGQLKLFLFPPQMLVTFPSGGKRLHSTLSSEVFVISSVGRALILFLLCGQASVRVCLWAAYLLKYLYPCFTQPGPRSLLSAQQH